MRTLAQIIEAAKANEPLEIREARFALCAISALSTFDGMGLEKLAEAEREKKTPILTRSAVWQHKEHHDRWHAALNKTPEEVLGANWNPENPEYQKRRAASLRLLDRLARKEGGAA